MPVPQVLLSGNHENIQKWRRLQALYLTRERRPDLFGRGGVDLLCKNRLRRSSIRMRNRFETNDTFLSKKCKNGAKRMKIRQDSLKKKKILKFFKKFFKKVFTKSILCGKLWENYNRGGMSNTTFFDDAQIEGLL